MTTQYERKVRGYSPIAYWMLAEAAGADALCEIDSNQDGTYHDVTLGETGIGDGNTCPDFDMADSYVDNYSTTFRDAFDGNVGSVAIWAKVSGGGIWTDGWNHWLTSTRKDGDNYAQIYKAAAVESNLLIFGYKGGGTLKEITLATTPTDWFHAAITWDTGADEMKAYYNGSQTGSTLTGLGVFAGDIIQSAVNIGCLFDIPNLIWDGWLAHCAVWDTALSAADIADLATIVTGPIDLDARGRLGNLDVDTRIAQTARDSRIGFDMDTRVAQTARGSRVALDMDNRDD